MSFWLRRHKDKKVSIPSNNSLNPIPWKAHFAGFGSGMGALKSKSSIERGL